MNELLIHQPSVASAPLRALARLREGNDRFVRNVRSLDSLARQASRHDLVAGQQPFAVVLSCSDSRAPSEILFDQGLGDLFVIRVAGNVAAPSLIGSAEFAVATFGTPLVVVMGHSHCGAISATLDAIQKGADYSPNIRDIVDRIRPAVEPLVRDATNTDRAALARAAVRANVHRSVDQLRRTPLIAERVGRGELLVVGAEYALESGLVDFFEGVPS